MKKILAFIVLVSLIISVLVFQSFNATADINIASKLNYKELTLKSTTGITSDVAIGQLPENITIEDSSLVVPSSAKFSFTSDDGSEKDYKFRDVFTSRGVSCTIPVITDYISQKVSAGQVSIGHLLELQNTYGYEIGSHTYSHPFLTRLPYDDLVFQLTESKKIETEMGLRISNFFVPYGDYNDTVLNEAQKYYRSTRISKSGPNNPLDKRKMTAYWLDSGVSLATAKQIVNTAVKNNQFIIFGFHAGACSRAFMDNTVGVLIDYIQSFDNAQVLTVDKALDRIENVMTKDKDYKVIGNKIVLDKFFVRSLPIGENNITFDFSDGSSEIIKINISKDGLSKSVTGIAITSMPDKTNYFEGEALSTNGMQVTAYYSDGSSSVVDNYTVSGYTSTVGTKTITVKYEGFETQFNVTVTAKQTAIDAPTSLKAVSATYNSIKLTWTAVSGASGYGVYSATDIDGPYTIIASPKSLGYTNSGLSTGTTYYYKVSAYKISGTTKIYGNQSAAVSTIPVPKAPTNFNAVKYSASSIKLTWYAVPGANGYELFRSDCENGDYSLVLSTGACSYINKGLTTNNTYYYKVRPYSLVNGVKVYGDFSVVKSATPY